MSQRQQSDFAGTCQNDTVSLRHYLNELKKQVTVEIDLNDLQALKNGKYILCVARKVVEGDYNVVWQSSDKYLANNTFSWTPQYQMFGSNQFTVGETVVVSTNTVNIGLGETATLDSDGILEPSVSGGSPTGLSMHNEYGSIHVGVNQLCTQLDGTIVSSPIYVSTEALLKGIIVLTPLEKVLVWFQQNIATGTMFSKALTNNIELDLTETNSMKCLFKDQQWSLVG